MNKELIKQIIGENQYFVRNVTFMKPPFKFEVADNYVFNNHIGFMNSKKKSQKNN